MENIEHGSIGLVLLQILVVIGNAYLFARQKNKGDLEKRDIDGFRLDLSSAMLLSQEAKRDVQSISVSHYEALRVKYETVIVELRDAQAKIRAMEETIGSLSNKLASRERADIKMERILAKEAQQAEESSQLDLDLDEIIRSNGTPLNNPPADSGPGKTSFGKISKR